MKKVPTNLSNLKRKVDQVDFDKLVPVPFDLSKLSDVSKNYFVKKGVYIFKINKPHITNLATNTTLNAKINEVKNEIPNITNLAATAAFNAKIN